MKPRKAFEIKTPGMNMWRMSASALQPGKIRADGIEQTRKVGEEGAEEQQPDQEHGTAGEPRVFPVPESSQRFQFLAARQFPDGNDQGCKADGGECEHKGLLRGKHQPTSNTCQK